MLKGNACFIIIVLVMTLFLVLTLEMKDLGHGGGGQAGSRHSLESISFPLNISEVSMRFGLKYEA